MALVVGTNSFVTVEEADAYLAASINAAEVWEPLETETKEGALITAFRYLQRLFWSGAPVVPGQAAPFPRTGLVDPYGYAIPSDSVPQFVKDAQIELAYAMTQDPLIANPSSSAQKIKSLKAGSAAIEYFEPASGGARFPSNVWDMIAFYVGGTATMVGGLGNEAFGIDDTSHFYVGDQRYPWST